MGKKLIINGADFSINGFKEEETLSLAESFSDASSSLPNASPFWQVDWSTILIGKHITAIELKIAEAGTLTIGVTSAIEANPTILRSVVLNVESTGLQKISLDTPFLVNSGEYFFIQDATDTCIFRYASGISTTYTPIGFYSVVRSSGTVNLNSHSALLVSIYGY